MRSIILFLALAASALAPTVAAAQTPSVKEPAGLWPGPMHSATPATLKGAMVIDAKRLGDILREKPAMIDVSNLDPRPPSRPPDQIWQPVHRSLPGATWLPGSGAGTGDPKFAAAFKGEVEKLTGGDKDKPVVTFCHPNRWGSWNAAKRLVGLGYRHVYWFPGGSEGWVEAGHTLSETKPATTSPVIRSSANENPETKL